MSIKRLILLCGLLGVTFTASPALAGCGPYGARCWEHAHHVIYHMQNRIAFLEADPYIDDGYKGPIITHLHRKVLHIRAVIGPHWPHWPTPCCYSRRPIYIR
ncbi:MAG: hypothetical protein ACRECE_12800 [Xanthobacteraceae bacterium]